MRRFTRLMLAGAFALLVSGEALALITGGEGNQPLPDPGWPAGAAAIFNHPGRIAWWEGPPFGGGEWHSECRGDTQAFMAVLADFARLDGKIKRVVVHDGTGHSFWLAPNREPEKLAAAKIDWSFTVWRPASWERLRKLPADLNPTASADPGPPLQLDVHAADIRWADVTVPGGIEVTDLRLEAHGFTVADGTVLEGRIVDLAAMQPISAAVRLERIEPRQAGGYRYRPAAEAAADARGRWVLKGAPAGWFRIVASADGYVPRVIGHARFDGQPGWHAYDGALARPGAVAGRVTDPAGRPLADAEVRLGDVGAGAGPGGRYESPDEYRTRTDADGRFRLDNVPAGRATAWVRKAGYVRPGLGPAIETPRAGLELQMTPAARLVVTVDFAGRGRPGEYLVSLSPEGGDVVGSHGGSGQIDAENRFTFDNAPPGRYFVRGQPNPTTEGERTEPVPVELEGGRTTEVTIKAR